MCILLYTFKTVRNRNRINS